jgi:glucose-1-phosphate thymidylyltransferase
MKAIVLAGGKGTRLWPLTAGYSKQLLPVYDKPMIHYSLATALHAGIREILIVTSAEFLSNYRSMLGDGKNLGIEISYAPQTSPNGIAEGLLIGEKFLDGSKVLYILGDNIFHGASLGGALRDYTNVVGAQIFGYKVSNPTSYGVVEVSENGQTVSIEEKPEKPRSYLAIPGLYFFDELAVELARKIKPSERGELEITDLLLQYMKVGKLQTKVLPRGTVWLDAGTPLDLQRASNYVQIVEERQGMKISCLEEISYMNGWIDRKQISKILASMPDCDYRNYLLRVCI